MGLNQWNGVAIASRVGWTTWRSASPVKPEWQALAEARAIGATCGGGGCGACMSPMAAP